MHKLLKRQIKNILKKMPEEIDGDLSPFIDDINEAYEEFDRELGLLERIQSNNAEEINKFKECEKDIAVLTNKANMLDSFSRFVPKQFLKFLNKEDITQVELGDATMLKMSILFSDIRNFTTLSESMTVAENFRFLNSYMKRMGPVIHELDGFIDKFIGDAIMALFPPGFEDNALRAAIEMRRVLAIYNEHRMSVGYRPIDIGIGLNNGELMLGTVGSPARLDTTVIGDSVNLASRMESLSKDVGAKILITEFMYAALADPSEFHLRKIGKVLVAGKNNSVDIYEVMDDDGEEIIKKKESYMAIFEEALKSYKEAKFEDAFVFFKECRDACPEDMPVAIYFARCKQYMVSPPLNFDGITIMSK